MNFKTGDKVRFKSTVTAATLQDYGLVFGFIDCVKNKTEFVVKQELEFIPSVVDILGWYINCDLLELAERRKGLPHPLTTIFKDAIQKRANDLTNVKKACYS